VKTRRAAILRKADLARAATAAAAVASRARKEKDGKRRRGQEKPVQGGPPTRAATDPDHSLSSTAGHGHTIKVS